MYSFSTLNILIGFNSSTSYVFAPNMKTLKNNTSLNIHLHIIFTKT